MKIMKVIIWTHGFDTHSKLENTYLENASIFCLEEENSLLWSDINEENVYRQEMYNNNSDEIIDLTIDEYDEIANRTKKTNPKKQVVQSRIFLIFGPAFSIVKSDLSMLSIETA